MRTPEQIIVYQMWQQAKRRSIENHLLFTIKVSDIHIPKFCPALGIPLFRTKGQPGPNSPTLDRVNNSKGYTPTNICVISYRANMLKKDGTAREFEDLARYIRALEPIEDSLDSTAYNSPDAIRSIQPEGTKHNLDRPLSGHSA